jgi:hypothetical protein
MKGKQGIVLIVLAAGTAVRFYGYPNIPFTYDELSAWGRTDFSSWRDLIDRGVRGDGHPALIQVFLFCWRKLFGDSEAAFKVPFLLMGIAGIYLTYLLGKKWFSEMTGLVSAAFVSVLQYTVMYSQIARPYISGLFLSLLMVICWSNVVLGGNAYRRRPWLIGFIVFATLCCYNHYFSLLFAFIVGVSGYFFLPRKEWKEYSAAGGIVAVLFLPHLSITQDQLRIGGVGGWLAKPDRCFFGNYLQYVFDFSWLVITLVVLLVVGSFFVLDKEWKSKNRLRLLCACWFLMPFIVGYLYSRYRNPVLQYSVLIFSFPYLLLLLFSFFGEMKAKWQGALMVLILLAGSYSLIFERLHYSVFYKQPVEQMAKAAVDFSNEHPGRKSLILIMEPQKYMNYYLVRWKSTAAVQSFGESAYQDYVPALRKLKEERPDFVLCGNLPYPHLKLFMKQYPKIVQVEKGFTYDFFVLAKDDYAARNINERVWHDTLTWENPSHYWNIGISSVKADSSSGLKYYRLDSTQEFGPGFSAPVNELMKDESDYLMVEAGVRAVESNATASIVISFEDDGKQIFYQQKPLTAFVDSGRGYAVNAVRFRDFRFSSGNAVFKFYICNPSGEMFDITSMNVEVMKGNPLVYSLIEPIRRRSK